MYSHVGRSRDYHRPNVPPPGPNLHHQQHVRRYPNCQEYEQLVQHHHHDYPSSSSCSSSSSSCGSEPSKQPLLHRFNTKGVAGRRGRRRWPYLVLAPPLIILSVLHYVFINSHAPGGGTGLLSGGHTSPGARMISPPSSLLVVGGRGGGRGDEGGRGGGHGGSGPCRPPGGGLRRAEVPHVQTGEGRGRGRSACTQISKVSNRVEEGKHSVVH